MIIPKNVTLRFFDWCEGCELCNLKVEDYTVDPTKYFLYCTHAPACGRIHEQQVSSDLRLRQSMGLK